MKNLDEMTPYGFTYAQAIEALKFKNMVENDETATNNYRKSFSEDSFQRDLERTFTIPKPCSLPGCSGFKYLKQKEKHPVYYYPENDYCDYHLEFVGNKSKKALEFKKIAEEKKRLSEVHRLESYDRKLRYVIEDMDLNERRSQQQDLATIRIERASELKRRKLEKTDLFSKKKKSRVGYVYHIFNENNVLLYVGKSIDVQKRFFYQGGHKNKSSWWEQAMYVRVIKYANENSALLTEILDIKQLNPIYNISRPEPKFKRRPPKVDSSFYKIDSVSNSLIIFKDFNEK